MMKRVVALSILATVAVYGQATAQSDGPADLINGAFQDKGTFLSSYPLGQLTVKADTPLEKANTDIPSGTITLPLYRNLLCLARLGYVQFLEDTDVQAQASTGNPLAFSQVSMGLVRRINVRVTPAGSAVSTKYSSLPTAVAARAANPSKPIMFVRVSEPRFVSLVEDRKIQKDLNEYRVIKARVQTSATPEGERQISECGQSRLASNGNMIALFKKDSFSGKWVFQAWDYLFGDGTMTTNVETALSRAN